jgi:TolA protein
MTFRLYGEPQEDKRLRQMILLSAVFHVVVILWVIVGGALSRSPHPRATAITVELVNPAALGTNLPNGGKGGGRGEGELSAKPVTPPPPVKQEVKPQPQEKKPPPPMVRKDEPKPLPPPVQQKEAVKLPEKEKPIEKSPVKLESEKAKVEEKKPEPKKVESKPEPAKVAKVEEKKPEAKVEPEKTPPKKIEEKKPDEKKAEPQKTEVKPQKPEGKPEKLESKPEKAEVRPETEKPPVKATEKKPEETPAKTETASPEERDRQISAALDRIKSQVQPKEGAGATNSPPGNGPKGTGPITRGGEVGEGGGGAVRGIEFILYTQRLQRRVQESWIVAEKRPGLVASVSFKIQADGEVQDVELMKSSGDVTFDQSVLRAVRKATPFPPPPQSYADEFATQKIFMNFGGEGRVN